MPCPSLPTELLTQIIVEAAIELPAGDTYQRNKDLRSFSLVSSLWRAIAQAELIRQPTVGTIHSIRELADRIVDEPRLQKKMKSLRFFARGNDEAPLEEALRTVLGARNVDLESVSICYRKVSQRRCLLLDMYCYTCCNLTSVALSLVELQVIDPAFWGDARFPHLHTLDLRRVTVDTGDEEHFFHKLNDRSEDVELPFGRVYTTPSLRNLRISASGIGSLNLGDFVELADQITDLSLGVYADHGFLEPKLLDKFKALETLELDWPLEKEAPFHKVKVSGCPLKVLRIRDRHDRFLTESEWNEVVGGEWAMCMEWDPENEGAGGDFAWSQKVEENLEEREGSSAEPSFDSEDEAEGDEAEGKEGEEDDTGEEEEDDEDVDDLYDEEADKDWHRILRLEHIAETVNRWLEEFPSLHTLVLPLKFGPIIHSIDAPFRPLIYYDHPQVVRLVSTCEELGVEIKVEERCWETDLAYKELKSV